MSGTVVHSHSDDSSHEDTLTVFLRKGQCKERLHDWSGLHGVSFLLMQTPVVHVFIASAELSLHKLDWPPLAPEFTSGV